MKLAGVLLLLAGWGVILAAIVLIAPLMIRSGFVLSGVGVEGLGLGLLIHANRRARAEGRRR